MKAVVVVRAHARTRTDRTAPTRAQRRSARRARGDPTTPATGIVAHTGTSFIGFIVTLFLLPCTMGPYIVASGLLADLGTLGALPWLLYYNLVFVLPMLIIVGIVYFGFAKIDDVTGWKDKHVRALHLVAGILLFLVGLAILMRWI